MEFPGEFRLQYPLWRDRRHIGRPGTHLLSDRLGGLRLRLSLHLCLCDPRADGFRQRIQCRIILRSRKTLRQHRWNEFRLQT